MRGYDSIVGTVNILDTSLDRIYLKSYNKMLMSLSGVYHLPGSSFLASESKARQMTCIYLHSHGRIANCG